MPPKKKNVKKGKKDDWSDDDDKTPDLLAGAAGDEEDDDDGGGFGGVSFAKPSAGGFAGLELLEDEDTADLDAEMPDFMAQVLSASKKKTAPAPPTKQAKKKAEKKPEKKAEKPATPPVAAAKKTPSPTPAQQEKKEEKAQQNAVTKATSPLADVTAGNKGGKGKGGAAPAQKPPTEEEDSEEKQQKGDSEAIEGEADEGEGGEAEGGAKSKNKKKKKKPAAPAAAAADSKKKPSAAGAAIKAALERQKAEEERLQKLQEEEERRIEEENRQKEEELKKIEEQKRLKKEKEKAKKERLKQEGKYLTPAQRAQRQKQQQILERLQATKGIVLPTLDDEDKPTRPMYTKKKRFPSQSQASTGTPGKEEEEGDEEEEEEATEEATKQMAELKVEEKKKETKPEDKAEVVEDSWETVDVDEAPAEPEEEVVDSWEQLDVESDPFTPTPVAQASISKVLEKEQAEVKAVASKSPQPIQPIQKTHQPAANTAVMSKRQQKQAAALKKAQEKSQLKEKIAQAQKGKKGGKASKEEESEEEDSEEEEDEETEEESEEEEDDEEEEEDDEEEESDDDEEEELERERRKAEAKTRREKRYQEALANRSKDNLRSPICVVMGHVDVGKTKLLDKIRQTNVQDNEAGGITQQIGATYFPEETIRQKTEPVKNSQFYADVKVPGLLIMDTPGHESFSNLRSRGSSLCNIAILVVDIMHYLEPQTIESIQMLKQRKTPFIVALNKIDRIYGWKSTPNGSFEESLKNQEQSVLREFEERLSQTKVQLAEQGLNSELYFRSKDLRSYVSIVPTSAHTGEGVPDMIMLLVYLTQRMMSEQLMYLTELEATVLEVKVIEGQGTTIDVILSNGQLREGDKICVCGMSGPIVTNIRALLTPQPLRELRVKSAYVHHKMVKAAQGVKIAAAGLEKAVAGSRLMVIGPDDDEEDIKEEVMSDLAELMKRLDTTGRGVSVQASTLGSLEALLSFLKDMKIPVSTVNIGPVHKKDVMRASIMLEHAKEYALILCFDVKVDKEIQEFADELGVKIFKADIIYHLFDQFTAHMNAIREQRKKDNAPNAVFPCRLKIVPDCVFNKRSPIVVGVEVLEGTVRIGSPLCVPVRSNVFLGRVSSIENNKVATQVAKKGQNVAIKIELPDYETPRMVGRHFDWRDEIVSQITRESIDIMKESFRKDMTEDDWKLIIALKKVFNIP